MTDSTRDQISFKLEDTQFNLWRLGDDEYQQLRQHSLPIKQDAGFMFQLALSEHCNPDRLTLPEAFLTLEALFGKTSTQYDPWKGSFSFPLLMVLTQKQGRYFYLLRILDHRGCVDFPLYRLLEQGASGYNIDAYRAPYELEFPTEAINKFIGYLYGYLKGASTWVCKISPPAFLKQVASNFILYGCRDGTLFEESFESDTDYHQAIEAFNQTYEVDITARESKEIQSLLQRIIKGSTQTGKERGSS
ncbi:hypothetical protein [Acaryochloris sp. CCMEE 5410]|uniref:hypothetical protein n=1 Tax=Acaryochloris sp. CCMEE 5410 TaxID=310037 RepID=UPI000248446D|nr:hypothetical protein [Acaryochloris sp. CCMEE 5410]KAI9129564.1 hypothetical protein ON05_033185 [Acaryochloris sp. CCMEE 5410]